MPDRQISKSENLSEEIQDIINKIPNNLIRYGSSIITVVIVLVLFCTWFIKYPEVIKAPLKLTSINSPKAIVAKLTGRIDSLLVKDHELIKKNQVLLWLESTADHAEVIQLSEKLAQLLILIKQDKLEDIKTIGDINYNNLGQLQPAYQIFDQQYISIQSFLSKGFYLKKSNLLKSDLENIQKQNTNLKQQLFVLHSDYKISQNEFDAQQKLAVMGAISPIEFKREESKLLIKSLPLKQTEASLISNLSSINAKKNELLELEKLIIEQKSLFLQALNTFISEVENWKQKYLLVAPITGRISFNSILQQYQSVAINQEVLYIIQNNDNSFGEIRIPQFSFGKIKVNQKALIAFDAYPFAEFGKVEGHIIHIADIPDNEGNYQAIINFDKGLITQYNKRLIFRNGMAATAEIITDDLRLFERLLNSLKKNIVK